MPGVDRLSIAAAVEEAREAAGLGLAGRAPVRHPRRQGRRGLRRLGRRGHRPARRPGHQAGRARACSSITDVCLCEYTTHGHCGVLGAPTARRRTTTPRSSCSPAPPSRTPRAGADIVAPSRHDGRARRRASAPRSTTRASRDTPILAYSAKFASAFYGPFREAAGSAPAFGDRRGYQMDPANAREAVREALLDVDEGADMVMVKPALRLRRRDPRRQARPRACPSPPTTSAASTPWSRPPPPPATSTSAPPCIEILTSLRRAGADVIITYHAKDAARWLAE